MRLFRGATMNTHVLDRPVEILLVEDNPGDVRLTQEAFREAKLWNRLQVVDNGMNALAYLRQEGQFSSAKRPDLVLLDLNLPGMDGKKVLTEIKSDNDLKKIPVLILTSSAAEEDINKTYECYANCYLQKPSDLDQFINIIKIIKDFWFSIAKLPTQ